MDTLLGQLIFCVGSEEYRWDDVILAAKLRGDWAGLEKELCEGMACVKRMDEAEEEIDAEELESAANDFRYERDLVTAEEAEAWLKQWNLTAEAWMDYIRRWVLRRKWADELAEIVARFPVTRISGISLPKPGWIMFVAGCLDESGRTNWPRSWLAFLSPRVRSMIASRPRRSVPVIWRASPRRSLLGRRRLPRRGKRFGFAKQRRPRRG